MSSALFWPSYFCSFCGWICPQIGSRLQNDWEPERRPRAEVPSRGVLRLALSHDRQEGRGSRRSAAWRGEISKIDEERRLGQSYSIEPDTHWCSENRSNIGGINLTFGKQTEDARIGRCLALMMQGLVKLTIRGEYLEK